MAKLSDSREDMLLRVSDKLITMRYSYRIYLLSYVVNLITELCCTNWNVNHQMDAATTFLNGELEEEIYRENLSLKVMCAWQGAYGVQVEKSLYG